MSCFTGVPGEETLVRAGNSDRVVGILGEDGWTGRDVREKDALYVEMCVCINKFTIVHVNH